MRTVLYITSVEDLLEPKVQHEPHMPWSLTSVKAPFSRQSTTEGRAPFVVELA